MNKIFIFMLCASVCYASNEENNNYITFKADITTIVNNINVLKLLLQCSNIDINKKYNEGDTILHYACLWDNAEAVKLLLESPNVDVNIQNDDGLTPVHIACLPYAESNAIDTNVLDVLLKKQDIDLTVQDKYGYTPFHLCCIKNNKTALKYLLNYSTEGINIKEFQDEAAPLHFAASYGFSDIVRLLIKIDGIELESQMLQGWTPRLAASKHNQEEVEKIFAEWENRFN